MNPIQYPKTINASPVKRFFVEMLTRDIQIEDAILDLLDNCVDGILRNAATEGETPYSDFWAKITVTGELFEIEDNCGGIPWSSHDRAFRMGRPEEDDQSNAPLSVGVYGIGMKRAIFKMGNSSFIMTQNGKHNYQVLFTEEWINNPDDWNLQVEPNPIPMERDGTHLIVQDLHKDVQERFSADSFAQDLLKRISSHYAVIIRKGFRVEVNGVVAEPNPIIVRFDSPDSTNALRPYMFQANYDGVDVFLAVGLREPIPGFDRISDEQDGVKFSSDYAGWTVICNDRVVLYCDRSELTGWGVFGVPRYHTQFIAISGVVEFKGDPTKLPTTTTKRGLKLESSLYQQVLERMREGLRIYIDFTNKWKTMESEAEKIVSSVPALSYSQVRAEAQKLTFAPTKSGLVGSQYKPKLPMPENTSSEVRLSYTRPKEDVFKLAEKLFPDNLDDLKDKEIPRSVGVASFEYVYNTFFGTKRG